jgi:hypothetical protein
VVEIWAGKKQESVTMAYNMPNKYVRWSGTMHFCKIWSNFLSSKDDVGVAKVR